MGSVESFLDFLSSRKPIKAADESHPYDFKNIWYIHIFLFFSDDEDDRNLRRVSYLRATKEDRMHIDSDNEQELNNALHQTHDIHAVPNTPKNRYFLAFSVNFWWFMGTEKTIICLLLLDNLAILIFSSNKSVYGNSKHWH